MLKTAAVFSLTVFSLTLVWLVSVPAFGENWPNWRGPSSDGVVQGSGYPIKWSEAENVVWKVKLPGWGTSTPAIWGEQIFVSCEDQGNNGLVCLDRNGQQLWKVAFGPAAANRNRKASGANPSPVSDGQHVYAYYKARRGSAGHAGRFTAREPAGSTHS